jgi:hypothetical protein
MIRKLLTNTSDKDDRSDKDEKDKQGINTQDRQRNEWTATHAWVRSEKREPRYTSMQRPGMRPSTVPTV